MPWLLSLCGQEGIRTWEHPADSGMKLGGRILAQAEKKFSLILIARFISLRKESNRLEIPPKLSKFLVYRASAGSGKTYTWC
jgi:hypothetical protein